MMTNELGMGMVIYSTPCALIFVELASMTGLDISNMVAPDMCSFCPIDLPKEIVQDEYSANVLIEANKAFKTRIFLVDHDPNQANETLKNEITSNDTMVQNLKNLDVNNSGSVGHSVTSTKPKCKKVFNEDKLTLKKKNIQSTSAYPDIP
ncbi:hypothetical protein Ancab_004487 [Ancistrocladus abbreviatus]